MRDSFGRYNVIAAFADLAAARHAISTLEGKGVDAGEISLLGRAAEQAQQQAETYQRDDEMIAKGMRTFLGGAAAGTVAGGVVGFLAGLAAFGLPGVGPVMAGGIWATVLGGAAAGGGVGSALAGYAKIKQSEAWELALRSVETGQVILGVHSDRREDIEAAAELLRGEQPESLNCFDAEGRPLRLLE